MVICLWYWYVDAGDEPKCRQSAMNTRFIGEKQENKTHEGAKQTKQTGDNYSGVNKCWHPC